MKILNNLPQIFGNISNDILKFIDKTDSLKEILQKDELLSSTSIGKVIQFFVKEAIKIGDKNEAFKSAIGLVYLQSLLEAMEFHQIEVTTLGINEAINFDVKSFEMDSFFDNELVKFYEGEYKRVLKENALIEEEILKLQKYIRDNAKINFFKLLENEPIVYEELINYLKSDKRREEFKKNQKEIYKSYLKSRYEDVIFNNEKNLTLKDVYIEPYFKVHRNCFKYYLPSNIKGDKKGFVNIQKSINESIYSILRKKGEIYKLLNEMLDKDKIQVIFLLGYAGQGKSSFCKRFMYDVISQKKPFSENIYFVELKNIPNPRELIEKPFDTLKKYIEEETEIEDFNSSILILDGLDELFMKSGLASSDIDKFCIYLIENVKKQKIIVTSRYGYISLENRKLTYKNSLVVELQELNKEQQINWIKKYKKFFSDLYLNENKLNELYENENKYIHILELLNQPILLYMMVTIGEFDENLNRSKLYSLLFTILIERKWTDDGIKESLKEVLRRDLRKILQDIAIEIYQSNYEYIHKSRVEEIESVKRFKKDLENIFNSDGLKNSLRALMVSFYFRETKKSLKDNKYNFNDNERNNEYAIEFLHKSLMEYLVAEKIWVEVKKLANHDNEERNYKVKDWRETLNIIFGLFSKKKLSIEVVNYLIEVIKNDKDINKKEIIAKRLKNFFPIFLERDFIYEVKLSDKFSPHEAGLYTFYGFWTLLSHIKNENHLNNEIKEKFVYILKAFVNLDTKQSHLINLSKQDLSHVNLKNINLYNANLIKTNLDSTDLTNANLEQVDLTEANLIRTNLIGTNLPSEGLGILGIIKSKNLDKAIEVPKNILEKWKKANKK